jgi:DNA-binding XRE family transcriptional regulator
MNARIDFQIINDTDGQPAFVVVPYAEYLARFNPLEGGIPHAIVRSNLIDGVPMARAWREHLGLTQAEVAERAGMSQAALSQIESGGHKARKATRAKLALAMGITADQLA